VSKTGQKLFNWLDKTCVTCSLSLRSLVVIFGKNGYFGTL